MRQNFYAHSLKDKPPEDWQPLEQHLYNVAKLARRFAEPFGGDQWAYLAGLWHDLGKYSDEFQAKLYAENGIESHLETKPGKVVHSEAGGHLASLKGWQGADRVLSWLIMGHHAGLTDFSAAEIGARALEPKMRDPSRSEDILKNAPAAVIDQDMPRQVIPPCADPAFFISMLFSCVVDADFLDTEVFMNKTKAKQRGIEYPKLEFLLEAFSTYMEQLCAKSESGIVNQIRTQILEMCRKASQSKPDIFSLTVPTGGGKTLSSLAFALHHAVRYKKSRIIYIIPYTSIIEQTADVFRKIPGFENAVIEHHSNVAETDEDKETVRARLASENWDAPLIITTSVQFFESLYACKTSRCRKLHNIVNSVIIFDEAQCLPPEYLRPCVFAIRELFQHYHVTPLLCTATQPVLTQTKEFDFNFKEGFDSVREIVGNPNELAAKLKRVEIDLFREELHAVNLTDIAKAIEAERQSVLCIVNRKDDARALARMLPSELTFHLSTNMCAEHRTHALEKIKKRLHDNDLPLFTISTSLVEAGVDIDFPIVYRALAGLDSIAQAAGRCNREGKLPGFGRTIVFVPVEQPDYVKQPAGIARELLHGKKLDNLLSPENYEYYFRQRFWQLGEKALDRKNILQLSSGRGMNYYFRTAAQKFRFIEDDWQVTVVAPYGSAIELIARLTAEPWNQRALLRKLGRYSIGIPRQIFKPLAQKEYIRESGYPGLFLLDYTLYDDTYGFISPGDSVGIDPEKFFM